MIKLNKVLMLILLIGFIVLLTACDYEYYLYHEFIRNETEVDTIELIRYNNPDAQENPLIEYSFDVEKLEVLEKLDNNVDEFLTDIEKIGGLSSKLKQVLKSANGFGIRINYIDKRFTLITVTNINGVEIIYSGQYGLDEKIEGSFGVEWQEMIDDFKVLINEYFVTQID